MANTLAYNDTAIFMTAVSLTVQAQGTKKDLSGNALAYSSVGDDEKTFSDLDVRSTAFPARTPSVLGQMRLPPVSAGPGVPPYKSGNYHLQQGLLGGSITVPLISCLTGLESAV